MLIGVPREIKDNENRVAIVPAGVDALVRLGTRYWWRQMPVWVAGLPTRSTRLPGRRLWPPLPRSTSGQK